MQVCVEDVMNWCQEFQGRRVYGRLWKKQQTHNIKNCWPLFTHRKCDLQWQKYYSEWIATWLNLSHGTLVNINQDSGFNEVCVRSMPLSTNGKPQEIMSGLCCVISSTIFCQWWRISLAHCHRRWHIGLPSYGGDKMYQCGMGTPWFSTMKKV